MKYEYEVPCTIVVKTGIKKKKLTMIAQYCSIHFLRTSEFDDIGFSLFNIFKTTFQQTAYTDGLLSELQRFINLFKFNTSYTLLGNLVNDQVFDTCIELWSGVVIRTTFFKHYYYVVNNNIVSG